MPAPYRPHHLAPTLESARVWIVCHGVDSSASHVGLRISADYTAKALTQRGVWAEALSAKSVAELEKRLDDSKATAINRMEVRPSHVVISAPWIAAHEVARIANNHPEIFFFIVCHSNVGFLQADPHALKIMRGICDLQLSSHNVFAGGNSERFIRWATDAWRVPVAWVPNLYSTAEIFHHKDRYWVPGTPLRVGIFGANRPLKNHITSAAAAAELAIRYGNQIDIFMSSGRNEGSTDAAIREIWPIFPTPSSSKPAGSHGQGFEPSSARCTWFSRYRSPSRSMSSQLMPSPRASRWSWAARSTGYPVIGSPTLTMLSMLQGWPIRCCVITQAQMKEGKPYCRTSTAHGRKVGSRF